MPEWLYTIRERLTAIPEQRLADYRAFSRFHHITELVTLDSMMCPNVIDDLRTEDWEHNVHEDFRTELFRDVDYLLPHLNAHSHHSSPQTVSRSAVMTLWIHASAIAR